MSWSLILGGAIYLAGAQPAVAPDVAAPSSDDVDTIYLAPAGPYFSRWTIKRAKEQGEPSQTSRWEPLFRLLDIDGDERLDTTEFARVPWVQWNEALDFSSTVSMKSVDLRPQDETVSLVELAAHLDQKVPRMRITHVDLAANPATQSDFELLHKLLDPNRPEGIAVTALENATSLLDRFDYSNDEAIVLEELAAPSVQPRPPTGFNPRSPMEPPLIVLGSKETRGYVARRVIASYDRAPEGANAPAKKDGRLTAAELDLPAEKVAKFDADKDGGLDERELEDLLDNPPIHERVDVWSRARENFSSVTLSRSKADTVSSQTEIEMNNVPSSSVQLSQAPMLAGAIANFDRNKNGYLEPAELDSGPGPSALFRVADIDGDSKLFPEEWERYAALQLAAAILVVKVEVVEHAPSLFELLDENEDRRLSARELKNASARALGQDRNHDGVLAEDELTIRREFHVRAGDVRLPPELSREPVPLSTSSRIIVHSDVPSHPWFGAMDTNGDGDVSPREFLGPAAHFRRLDTNADGLIDAKEAEAGSALLKPK